MTTERTRADVQREIETKRAQVMLAYREIREAKETVARAESRMAVIEAQMVALATEEAEFDRQARRDVVGTIAADYKPTIFDPARATRGQVI